MYSPVRQRAGIVPASSGGVNVVTPDAHFEDALLLLLSSVAEHEAPSKGETFSRSWDFHSTKTVGQLMVALKKVADVPAEFDQAVREGVNARNEFVHGFFRDVDWNLLNEQGRSEMIQRLREVRRLVEARTAVVIRTAEAVMAASRRVGS